MITREAERPTIIAPIPLDEKMKKIYDGLHYGIRSQEDPVTWRTLIVDLRRLVNVEEGPDKHAAPQEAFEDAYDFVTALVEGTDLQLVMPDILRAIGEFDDLIEDTREGLDALLFNGRHFPEPLLYSLADLLRDQGKRVAVINPVGHYTDDEPRIVAPHVIRPIEHLVIMASTQTKQGGSLEVLSKVSRTIRNTKFTPHVRQVDVVIPMFGGSRGHRLGQDERLGYEVLEATINPKILSLTTRDVLEKLEEETGMRGPVVRFISVDIHNDEYPGGVFEEGGFEFISADPAPELADAAYTELKKRDCLYLPLKVVACDEGAIPRTESMGRALLTHPDNILRTVDIIYIKKFRLEAGVAERVELVRAERWVLTDEGKVVMEEVPMFTKDEPSDEECVILFSDDMLDTGGTAEGDMDLVVSHYPNTCLKMFAATHPVLSKGVGALDRVGADVYLFGNTLKQPELLDRDDVRPVDMAPAIARVILGSDS